MERLSVDPDRRRATQSRSDSPLYCRGGPGDPLSALSRKCDADAYDETVRRLARRLEVEPIRLAESSLAVCGDDHYRKSETLASLILRLRMRRRGRFRRFAVI